MATTLYYTTHASAIGNLLLVGSERGLCYLTLLENTTDVDAHLAHRFSTPPAPALLALDGFL